MTIVNETTRLPDKSFGNVRLGNKRSGAAAKPLPGDTVINIDRTNPVLGNPYVLQNHRDDKRRTEVIQLYKIKYEADIAQHGPMAIATEAIARKVRSGQSIILMCWCSGAPYNKPCHGDLIKAQIERLLELKCH